MNDIIGEALLDFIHQEHTEDIFTYSSLDEEDSIPLPYLFRNYDSMPKLEQKALELCKGKVLDIGCGAGSHSLHLQERNIDVIALDLSPGAIKTCKLRGLKNTIQTDILKYKAEHFDTLLLLMNGVGLAGRLQSLDKFLSHLKSLLSPYGQILLDSSDIIYMFDEDDSETIAPKKDAYYGEIEFIMKYKGQTSEPFYWLYLDFNTLKRYANNNNLYCELITYGDHYDYLARLTMR